jgi:hypothetical protein
LQDSRTRGAACRLEAILKAMNQAVTRLYIEDETDGTDGDELAA